MSVKTVEGALVLDTSKVEVLFGPGSEYEKRRIALNSEYGSIISAASKIKAVNSVEEAEKANGLGRLLQAGSKEVESFFKPIKQKIDSIKAPVLSHEKELKGQLDAQKTHLGKILAEYESRERKKREEAERIAREEAERQARESILEVAIEMEEGGDVEGANAVLDAPVVAPVVTQMGAPVKLSGNVSNVAYSCRVDNVRTLLRAIVEMRAPLDCIKIDESYLNRKAALDKESFSVPGCSLVKTDKVHFRA